MPFLSRSKPLSWTHHARAKMQFYKLSEGRVRRVLHSPKRKEEGVAPTTIAFMQPASMKFGSLRTNAKQEKWNQEIWVMVQDDDTSRKVISAWRYPGVTKPRSEAAINLMRKEYESFVENSKKKD